MKKNFKKLGSLALAFALVFSLSASVLAADLSADQAKAVALQKAGYAASDVVNLKAKLDYDDGVKLYDVSFYVPQADGSYLEYEFEIGAANGKVYDYDVEREGKANVKAQPNAEAPKAEQPKAEVKKNVVNGGDVGLAEAKKAALAHFGLNENEVKFYGERKEYDDGVLVYEFEFAKDFEVKYSCEVVAANGYVKDAEKEAVRDFGDKVELFFEYLIWALLNR